MKEISRQLVHISGVLFILLAQFISKEIAAAYFFLIALTFLVYSLYLIKENSRMNRLLNFLESRIREKVMHLERPGLPMQGAFWFYFSCGLVFWLFPLQQATVACLVLAISDSLATLVGKLLGTKSLLGKKSVEGTLTFFFSSFFITLAFFPTMALVVALLATVVELLPEFAPRLKKLGLLDDNLLIPITVSILLTIVPL